MAQLGDGYQVDKTKEEASFDPLPAGDYKAIIEESDLVDLKDDKGKMLKLTYKIIEGHAKDKKIFENLCIGHVSEEARKIAQSSLNAIGKACDMNIIKDSSQLHNIPMYIKVGVTAAKGNYGPGNKITKHESIKNFPSGGSAPSVPAIGSQKGSENSSSGKMPWEV